MSDADIAGWLNVVAFLWFTGKLSIALIYARVTRSQENYVRVWNALPAAQITVTVIALWSSVLRHDWVLTGAWAFVLVWEAWMWNKRPPRQRRRPRLLSRVAVKGRRLVVVPVGG